MTFIKQHSYMTNVPLHTVILGSDEPKNPGAPSPTKRRPLATEAQQRWERGIPLRLGGRPLAPSWKKWPRSTRKRKDSHRGTFFQTWPGNRQPLQPCSPTGEASWPMIPTGKQCHSLLPLQQRRDLGYTLSGCDCPNNSLQYADDACIVSDGTTACQCLLDMTDAWLQWSGMKAKVPKCYCLAVCGSSGRLYDPAFRTSGQAISFLGSSPIKFLSMVLRALADARFQFNRLHAIDA